MNTTKTDARHQSWIALESLAVKWVLVAVALLLLAIVSFIRADRTGSPEVMVTMAMSCIVGAMIILTISIFMAVIAAMIKRRVTAQIAHEQLPAELEGY